MKERETLNDIISIGILTFKAVAGKSNPIAFPVRRSVERVGRSLWSRGV